MTLLAWSIVLLSAGAAGWALYWYHACNRQMIQGQHALREAKRKISALEDEYLQKETQWQSTEEKLRGYLQLLDVLINTIPNPIYYKDQEGVFQGCNAVFAESILGLTRDRIIGRRAQEMTEQIPPDLAAAYLRQEMNALHKGSSLTHEAAVQCADGQRRDYLFTLAPIKSRQGAAIGSVSVLADLTEKNKAARVRLQKEKLEGVLETAGGVCHEFNQPLQALSGYLEILAVKIQSESSGMALIQKALDQVQRMGDTTAKLQRITHYETMEYFDKSKIIDIHKSSL
ncbi:MAG: PAS domain-containing protein [Desulfobacteraceae bacterium]|nr:PAS domain-containing protein [Desulfobacteraceae bacterium]